MTSSAIIQIPEYYLKTEPVTVAERSKAWAVFARADAVILGSNPTSGMAVWCVCVCARYFVFVLSYI
jgi:hypothetical protein